MTQRRSPRRAAVLVGLLLGLLAAVGAPAAPASAHAALVRTDPPGGAIVDAVPAEIGLTFSEPVRLLAGRIRVIAPDGKRMDNEATVRGSEVRVPVRAGGPRGTYLVSYRVISADSHPVGGAFTFSVGAPSATAPTVDTATRTERTVAIALGAAHFLCYAGLLLIVGPAIVLALLWPKRLPRRGPILLVVAGQGLLMLGTVAELLLQAPYGSGTTIFGASSASVRDVFASQYGAAHLVRLGVLAAVAFLLRPVLAAPTDDGRAGASTADRALLAILGVVGLATWPLSGHSGSSALSTVTAVADVAHLAAMSLWLGGLVALLGFLLRLANAKELDAVLPVWSRWATRAVGVLVVAGTVQAVVQIGSLDGLFGTTYGRLVLVKIGLLGVVLAAAAFARRLSRGGGVGGAGQPRRAALRRAVLMELTIVTVVLGVTSALVQTAPSRTAQTVAEQRQAGPYAVTLTSPKYSLQVTIDPAQPGDNSVHLFAFTLAGAPLPILEWKATAALPAEEIEPISMPLLPLTESHAVGEIRLPAPGDWEFSFTLRTTEIDQATVSVKVPIKG